MFLAFAVFPLKKVHGESYHAMREELIEKIKKKEIKKVVHREIKHKPIQPILVNSHVMHEKNTL